AVTRAQIASFLARLFDLDAPDDDFFADDDGSVHEASINAIAAAGITSGCGAERFCPASPSRRDQAATLLARA
ncbi:MAG: S-layer homology domain-containing protein, partial [Actinobacteria bacterium]|nr:S-layer homology domain-containing protein [Actinomycetota bacterium]